MKAMDAFFGVVACILLSILLNILHNCVETSMKKALACHPNKVLNNNCGVIK